MSESIARRTNSLANGRDATAMRKLQEAQLVDATAMRATIAALVVDVAALATALDTLAAKLNADGGVTDDDYSEANAAAVTSATPSALTVTS